MCIHIEYTWRMSEPSEEELEFLQLRLEARTLVFSHVRYALNRYHKRLLESGMIAGELKEALYAIYNEFMTELREELIVLPEDPALLVHLGQTHRFYHRSRKFPLE